MSFEAFAEDDAIRDLRAAIHQRDGQTIEEQVRLVAIAAPTGQERERGEYVRARLGEMGMRDVRVDEVGNVLATVPSRRTPEERQRPVVVSAHLDTVFPAGTEIRPRVEADRIHAPGITDNCRGLAALLAIGEVLRDRRTETTRPLLFAATVGEEGLGDLKGVKHLFREGEALRGAEAFISLDGAGVNRIVNRAIGATRLRVTFRGMGGHSWGDRGAANPAHAMGVAIAGLREIARPEAGNSAVTVGRVGGGTSVNAIPSSCWLELDLRSDRPGDLKRLEERARRVIESGARTERESARRPTPIAVEIEAIGQRPCGATPDGHPLVRAAVAATEAIGAEAELAASSTDANVPISLGIPAIAIGAGGRGGGVHTTDEWYENESGPEGIERALLTVLAVAGVHGIAQRPGRAVFTTD
jgi:tripeptide aminopeptidase